MSWASRRMRRTPRRGARRSGANGTTAGRPAGPGGMNALRCRALRCRAVRVSLQVLPGRLVGRSWQRVASGTGPSRPPPQSNRNSGDCEALKRRCRGSTDPGRVLRPMLTLLRAASPRWRTLQVIRRPAGRVWARGPAVPPRHQRRETQGALEIPSAARPRAPARPKPPARQDLERRHGRSLRRGPPAEAAGAGHRPKPPARATGRSRRRGPADAAYSRCDSRKSRTASATCVKLSDPITRP